MVLARPGMPVILAWTLVPLLELALGSRVQALQRV